MRKIQQWCGSVAVAAGVLASPAAAQCVPELLVASDGDPFDQFGNAVAVSDDVLVVGDSFDDINDIIDVGSAYIYRRVGGSWIEEQKINPIDGKEKDFFGGAVAVTGDFVVVGTWGDDDIAVQAGSISIYEWNGGQWDELPKIFASDADIDDLFGEKVAASGDAVLVGARFEDEKGNSAGAAYTYMWNGKEWVETQKLLASDGAAGDWFGFSVSIFGDVAIVGAPQHDDEGADSGAAYVFRWDGKAWTEEQKLVAADGAAGASFGRSVAVDGDLAVVGAWGDATNGTSAGAAYVFRFDGKAWQEETKLLASDGGPGDLLGGAAAVKGDVVLVGAYFEDEQGTNAGAAYLYRLRNDTWVEERKLLAVDGAPADRFGGAVALDDDTAFVGASRHDGSTESSGSVFAFPLIECVCPDLDGDRVVGLTDVLLILSVWGNEGGPEDIDGDGMVGLADLLLVLSVWGPCE